MKHLVILGAGSSKGCGFPLGNDMLSAVWPCIDDESRGLVRFLFPGVDPDQPTEPYLTFDRLYSVVDLFIKNNITIGDYSIRRMQGIKNKLFHAYISVLSRFSLATGFECAGGCMERERYDEVKKNYEQWYRPFFEKVIGLSSGEITFVSFNYDVLIDNVLDDLVQAKRISGFTYGVDLFDITDQAKKVRQDGIRLYKPHGSLNIVECPVCKRLFTSVTDHLPDFYAEYGCDACACPVAPVYKPPKVNKESDDFALNEVRDQVVSAIAEADEITVIGYALPNYDMNVLSMLAHGRALNKNKDALRIRLIDTDAKLKDKYESVFGVAVQKHDCHWGGFKSYAQSVL
jgi:hypothetical protein